MSDMQEIKTLIDAQGKAWEEFKAANDKRLSDIDKKGSAADDVRAKVDVINTDLNKLSKQLSDAMLELQRPNGQSKGLNQAQIEHKKAFDHFLKTGDDSGLKAAERKAMNSTSDPDGGYLVLPEIDSAIDRVASTMSAIARLSRTITFGTRAYQKRVKTSGMAGAWPGEGGTSGETTEPKFANVEIISSPVEVEPWVHNETLQDADIDLAMDLADEAAIGFGETEGAAFAVGNGVAKPRGITAYTTVANASYAWGSIGFIASGKSGAFASVAPADKLVDLQHSLRAQYRNGASWLLNDTVLGTLRQMKDGSGSYYLWQPDALAGFGGRFLGSPVEIDDNMPILAANSLSIAYANFQRAYAIVRNPGTALIRDPYTAKGQTKFNFRRRVGGGVINFEAIKLMKFST